MQLAELILKMHELPTLPAAASEIVARMQDDALTTEMLGEIIARDPALTAKVLRVANSSFYGLSRHVDSLEKAVMVLGFSAIKNLALSVTVVTFFTCKQPHLFDFQGLWRHSLGCGLAAKEFLRPSGKALADQAFLCGILHDIGKIVMFQDRPLEMSELLRLMAKSQEPQSHVEERLLGFSHAEVGALLAEKWNFPEEYSVAIRHHHDPFCLAADAPGAILATAVHVANKIAKVTGFGESTDPKMEFIPPSVWEHLGIPPQKLPGILAKIKADFEAMATVCTAE